MRRLTFKTPSGAQPYTITRRSRVTRRLHLELDEHGGLVVVAPGHWTKAYINSTLSQNTVRVERFLARARQRKLQPLLYVHGEQHFYLGTAYPLAIHAGTGRKSSVVLTGGEIRLNIRQSNAANVQVVLQSWYRQQAMMVFDERLGAVAAGAAWVGEEPIPLKLRRMKRTWGNCSSKGLIKLNTHLIKTPLSIIDSVIAHELCHLVEMNHGKAFYTLLEGLNPNWRRDRRWLRSEGNAYLQ